MLLPREQALRFIDGYKSVLLRILGNTKTPTSGSINDDLAAARTLAKADRGLLESALLDLAKKGNTVEPPVAAAIRSMRVDLWLYLRQTKTFAVFLDKESKNAYAVRALTTPLNKLLDEPPFALEAGLFEFEGLFVCDGLAINPVALGPGYRSQLTVAYAQLRKAGKFHAQVEA
jgi:hypothetical protein